MPLVPRVIVQVLALSLLLLLLARSLCLVAKGKGILSPPFSKRDSSRGETPRGQLLLEGSVGVSEGNNQPSFNWREVSAMAAWPETLPGLMVVIQEHPGAKEIPFIL